VEVADTTGVEIHGDNGYIVGLDYSLLPPLTQPAHDAYGGSIENRARIPVGC